MTRDFDDWYNEKVEQESYREFFNLKTKDDWDKWVRDKIIRRIEKLEDWQNGFKEDVITSFANRINKLEEGEKLTEKTENFLGERISKLEDWKDSLKDPFRGYYTSIDVRNDKMFQDKKIIDKQVWEDIKRFTESVYRLKYTKDFENQLSYLIHVIKKVDPEWEPDKK